jgi:hypothetical protein
MDNWDVMEKNVEMAKASTGTLEEQFSIYADGVAASEAALKASLEELKNSILNENSLSDIYETISDIVDFVDTIVDTLGGLPGILTIVAGLMAKAFAPSMATGIINMASSVRNLLPMSRKGAEATAASAVTASSNLNAMMGHDEAGVAKSFAITENAEINSLILKYKGNIKEVDSERINLEQ